MELKSYKLTIHKMPNMQVGSFLVRKPIRHARACKRPIEWERWQATEKENRTMLTLNDDLDGVPLHLSLNCSMSDMECR